MDTQKKITVTGVLSEGIGLGIKNAVSMLGATVLWLLTICLFKCRYYYRHGNHPH